MSTSGIFQLIINDGKQDRFLMASQALNSRLLETEKKKKKAGFKDYSPSLTDIEKSHILFVNAHFKPFAAIASEYSKVLPDSGKVDFSKEVRFTIPQFGDFLSDMCVHVVLKNLKAKNQKLYTTDPPGSPESDNLPLASDQVRYCEYPGERLFESTLFSVNGNRLSEKTSLDYVCYRSFTLNSGKLASWKKITGQQIPEKGQLIHNPGAESFSEEKYFNTGAQTWKPAHSELELWIPLLFWFNLDTRCAFPSVSIPYGQTFVDIKLANAEDIVESRSFRNADSDFVKPQFSVFELFINNIFSNPEIHDIFIKKIKFKLIRISFQETRLTTLESDKINLSKIRQPIESIFIGARPVVNKRDLQNWHKFARVKTHEKPFPVIFNENSLGVSLAVWNSYSPVFDKIYLTSHSTIIKPEAETSFYSDYSVFTRDNVNSHENSGIYYLPFNIYHNAYQPSGYINFSRSRENYFHFSGNTEKVEVNFIYNALNFLLISDGSAVLRYAT